MPEINYSQVNKDIALLTKQDPTLTTTEARDQAVRNQQLNNQLSSAFGFGGSGSQLSNFKFDTASIKNQFGTLGEEVSVAFTKSKNSGNKGSVPFPFSEESITVPSVIPNKNTASADQLGSLTAGADLSSLDVNSLKTSVSGMFNQAGGIGSQISSVVAGVGQGITSTIGGIKSAITDAGKKMAGLTANQTGEQKLAFSANPFSSVDEQLTAFKSYSAKLETETSPFLDQLKNKFGGLTSSFAASGNPRLGTLSLPTDKSVIVATQSSVKNIADVINTSNPDLSKVTTSINSDVLAAKASRAQLFPVDELESKFKSIGNALAPQANAVKIQLAPSLDSLGGSIPSTSNQPIDQAKVDKDVTTLMNQDPTLTEAEARDQASRNQQLNSSLTKAFGFGG